MKWRNRGKPLAVLLTVVLLAVLLFPFFVMLSSMLKSTEEVYTNPPTWIPKSWKFSNLVRLWTEFEFATYFKSSVIISLGSTILNTLITVPAAYAVARLRFVGRRMILYLFLVIQMFSPVIVVISLFKTMAAFRLLNTYFSLVLANSVFTIAFTIWMMNGYFRTIPLEIEEAAMIDGCSRFQALRKVMLPIAVPGITTVIIYCFTTAWNEFMFAMTFINSFEKRPITVGLFDFVGRWTVDWHYLMAASILATLPVVILFLFIEKQLVEGLAAGAVKG
jgi:multiple sugar transport system permease protein